MRTSRIVNASPLILLNKIGRIDLLNDKRIVVVGAVPVFQELRVLSPATTIARPKSPLCSG